MEQPIKTPAVEALLKQYGTKLVDALHNALPEKSTATGSLRDSIRFTITRFGISYNFELRLADYYEWVDKGRAPGKQPPIESILQWIQDKKFSIKNGAIVGNAAKTQGSKLKKLSDDLKLRNKFAFAIARKIGKHGTKGTNFYSSTVPDWIEELKREIPKALKRDVLVEIRSI